MNQIQAYSARENMILQRIINAVCAECRFMLTEYFTPDEAWIHALSEPACDHHCLLLAKTHDQVTGWCRLFPLEPHGSAGVFELGTGVALAYRRKGNGTRLIEAAIAWARSAHAQAIFLRTNPENMPAQRLFLKTGFQRLGVRNDQQEMILYL